MAEFNYPGDGSSFPTPKSNTNGSGSATFWANSFEKLVDRTKYLYDNLGAGVTALAKQTASSGDTLIGVLTYVGASLTLPTGTLRTVLQYIADNAAPLARFNTLAGGVAGASVSRISSSRAIPYPGLTWTSGATGDYTASSAGTSAIYLPLSDAAAPHGARLTAVSVSFWPSSAHASLAGLVMPQITLSRLDVLGNSTQIGATVADTSNLAAYNVAHSIAITGLTHNIDRSLYRYRVLFETEHAGANELAGTIVFAPSATVTIQ